jgi:hypothetical protein
VTATGFDIDALENFKVSIRLVKVADFDDWFI